MNAETGPALGHLSDPYIISPSSRFLISQSGTDGSNQSHFEHSYNDVFILVPQAPRALHKIGYCVNAKPSILIRENSFVNFIKVGQIYISIVS